MGMLLNRFAICCLLSVFVSGCSTLAPETKTDNQMQIKNSSVTKIDEKLLSTVDRYWKLTAGKDWINRYKLECADFRNKYNSEFYQEYHKKAWKLKEVVLLDSEISDDRVTLIKISVSSENPASKEVSSHIQWQKWVFENDGWYHVLQDPVLRF